MFKTASGNNEKGDGTKAKAAILLSETNKKLPT